MAGSPPGQREAATAPSSYLLDFLKQAQQLGTKSSNSWAPGGDFSLNLHKVTYSLWSHFLGVSTGQLTLTRAVPEAVVALEMDWDSLEKLMSQSVGDSQRGHLKSNDIVAGEKPINIISVLWNDMESSHRRIHKKIEMKIKTLFQ